MKKRWIILTASIVVAEIGAAKAKSPQAQWTCTRHLHLCQMAVSARHENPNKCGPKFTICMKSGDWDNGHGRIFHEVVRK
jgi:hypothetical protein